MQLKGERHNNKFFRHENQPHPREMALTGYDTLLKTQLNLSTVFTTVYKMGQKMSDYGVLNVVLKIQNRYKLCNNAVMRHGEFLLEILTKYFLCGFLTLQNDMLKVTFPLDAGFMLM